MVSVINNPEVVKVVKERVISMLERRGNWEGTMTDLLDVISSRRSQPNIWPGSASSLRRIFDQVVPSIRRAGFRVSFTRTSDRARQRMVSFTRVGKSVSK